MRVWAGLPRARPLGLQPPSDSIANSLEPRCPDTDPGALACEFDVLEKTYRWALAKAGSPAGTFWLCLISFAESSVFPLPPDVLLVPMVLATA